MHSMIRNFRTVIPFREWLCERRYGRARDARYRTSVRMCAPGMRGISGPGREPLAYGATDATRPAGAATAARRRVGAIT
jgi:hypothetical protein